MTLLGHGKAAPDAGASKGAVPPAGRAGARLCGSGCLAVVVFCLVAGCEFLGAEGLGDALVGGVGLAVDAVGVDLELAAAGRPAQTVMGTPIPGLFARRPGGWSEWPAGRSRRRAGDSFTGGWSRVPPLFR
jgi:hypothetical protein